MRLEVLPSARRHGVHEDDMLHAYRNAFRSFPDQGDHELTMLIGPARNGAPLEIGIATTVDGQTFIVHADKARPKYL